MKKNIQRKKDRKLRQSIEVLKAQLNVTSDVVSKPAFNNTSLKKVSEKNLITIDEAVVKKDLLKTMVLSTVGFSVILVLWALDITSFSF